MTLTDKNFGCSNEINRTTFHLGQLMQDLEEKKTLKIIFSGMVHCGFDLWNLALEAELLPPSLLHHKAESGTQINEKPLFCFIVLGTGIEPARAFGPQDFKSLGTAYKRLKGLF